MEWVKKLPSWAKTVIALFTSLIGLAILFINNKQLSIVIGIGLALTCLLGLSTYIIFSKEQSTVFPGRNIYRFPNYRPYAIVGAFTIVTILTSFFSIKQSREFVGLAFAGTPTLTATASPIPTPTPSPTTSPTPNPFADAYVELIDVSVDDKDRAPIIDIKVRNIGEKIAFLKRAVFQVLDYRIIPFCPRGGGVDSSYTYDVGLPVYITNLPYKTEINISQSIEPNDVDRFQFRMGTSGQGLEFIIYQLEIGILYNVGEDNKINTDKIIIAIQQQTQIVGYTAPGSDDPYYDACLKQYYENAIYMLNLPGIRSNQLADAKSVLIQEQKELLGVP